LLLLLSVLWLLENIYIYLTGVVVVVVVGENDNPPLPPYRGWLLIIVLVVAAVLEDGHSSRGRSLSPATV